MALGAPSGGMAPWFENSVPLSVSRTGKTLRNTSRPSNRSSPSNMSMTDWDVFASRREADMAAHASNCGVSSG